jgi:DNA-binding MarR family transcriptional regulator
LKLFAHLRATRAFRRRHLNFLETREDHDIVQEIGFHEEKGTPLTLKQLQLMGIASMPTLQRRLRRLRQLGAIVARRSQNDGRAVELTLSAKLQRTYERYAELIRGKHAGAHDADQS